MPERDDLVYIADMLDAVERAQRFAGGMDLGAFLADEKTQSAVIRQIEIIGEAARRVSLPFREAHADVPWQPSAAMRNVLIHEYFGVDLEEVWKTVAEDLPDLAAVLRAIIGG